jgi:hypothetical protein
VRWRNDKQNIDMEKVEPGMLCDWPTPVQLSGVSSNPVTPASWLTVCLQAACSAGRGVQEHGACK